MKKIVLLFVAGIMIMVSSAFAADGDLIVKGTLFVTGTSSTQVKVDITGGLKVNGVTFTKVLYINLNEDIYPNPTQTGGTPYTDTCNGNNVEPYQCLENEERTCADTTKSSVPNSYWTRTVTCLKNGYLMMR